MSLTLDHTAMSRMTTSAIQAMPMHNAMMPSLRTEAACARAPSMLPIYASRSMLFQCETNE